MTVSQVEYYKQLTGLDPIPARCKKCHRVFDGNDAIRAPSLQGCRCFWCGGVLVPIDYEAEREALSAWVHELNKLAGEIDAEAQSIHPAAWGETLAEMRAKFMALAKRGPAVPRARKRKA